MKHEIKVSGNELVLTLSGSIDEDAAFEESWLTQQPHVQVNLANVSAINSCGIREWIRWIQKLPENSQLVLDSVPKIVVDQINMVAGFLPPRAQISSFFVPYYCDSTGNEKMILFRSGIEFVGAQLHPPSEVRDDESGEAMEMDVIESKYFKFLEHNAA